MQQWLKEKLHSIEYNEKQLPGLNVCHDLVWATHETLYSDRDFDLLRTQQLFIFDLSGPDSDPK